MKRSYLLLLPVAVLFCGCKAAPPSAEAVTAAAAPRDPSRITATGPILKRIKLGQPAWASVGSTLTVAARVEVDETRVTRVGSPVMGRINSLSVHEGEEVHRGQLLALLTSTGLSDGQLQLLKALSQRQVAQRAVERAQLLLKADVIGSAELQRREAELAEATAELAAARDQLMLLGMPDDAMKEMERSRTLNSVSRIVASMDGTVLDRKVTLGQVVQPADTVFEIADLSNVWLVADVPEAAAGHVAAGQTVEAEIGAFPGQAIHGKLSFVSATVNPETRTVRVRMDLPNAKRRYKPAMLATMTLKDNPEKKMLVPAAAVVREGDTEYVLVHVDSDTYQLRKVVLGQEHGGRRVVTEGLQGEEKIIVDGAFHLNNERRRQLTGSDGAS
ncbi:MAG: efflux RND transporter periplasmic adaptor subunit [Bryobacterales bacterium]|nr:efflux RND transporter periplasmic adaptor subunit [Bryobacterales bacterium]